MQIPIRGMTCQGCAQTIQEAVSRLPGAHDVHVNFALKELSYEGVPLEKVLETVRAVGYDSPGPSTGAFKAPDVEAMASRETRAALVEFVAAAVFGVPEFLFGMGWLARGLPVWIEAALATIVVFGAGFDIHRRAVRQIFKKQVTMDTLVSLGSFAALLESYLFWIRGTHHPGFEAASTIVVFILLGRLLEARARRGTFSATAELFKAFQHPVTRLTAAGEETVTGLELRVADKIRLYPGEICPADGVVIDGTGQLNESSITGEPLPRTVKAGDTVYSGTVVLDSPITVLVKRAGEESFLGRLLTELEKAESRPVKLQRLADRVTSVFVPAVILTAALAALVQFVFHGNPELAFNVFLSVLLVACPCALGLAIPTALVAGLGSSARRGVLFRDAAVLEYSAAIQDLYFDKTGTLTMGAPRLTRLEVFDGHGEAEVLAQAAAVERGSLHPLARAILDAASEKGVVAAPAIGLKTIPGLGVEGQVKGKWVKVARGPADGRAEVSESTSDVTVDGRLAARLHFADRLRPEVPGILARLKELRFRLHLLTGDHAGSVKALGIEKFFDSVQTDLLPEDKKRIVEEARAKTPAKVAFVGDGINDVLALSAATVGFAVASGAPAALGAGSVSLARGIRDLPLAFVMAWTTNRQLKFNLFWAFAYNVVMLPWAVAGGLSPMWASLAMSASSVSVVVGSLFLAVRLQRLI